MNTQNGRISRRKLTLPSTFHTQRLLRRNTGTAQIITATTFDLVGSRSSSPTKITSWIWVITTPTTDTIEYRMASAPRPPVTRSRTAAGDMFTRSEPTGPTLSRPQLIAAQSTRALARATRPSQRALSFGVRSKVWRSQSTIPKRGP